MPEYRFTPVSLPLGLVFFMFAFSKLLYRFHGCIVSLDCARLVSDAGMYNGFTLGLRSCITVSSVVVLVSIFVTCFFSQFNDIFPIDYGWRKFSLLISVSFRV